MKIHYYRRSPFGFDTYDCKYSTCGFLAILNACDLITKNKKKVTCKNCKKTKLFKEEK